MKPHEVYAFEETLWKFSCNLRANPHWPYLKSCINTLSDALLDYRHYLLESEVDA